jgi:hypothetical protein
MSSRLAWLLGSRPARAARHSRRMRAAWLCAALLCAGSSAQAGRSCEPRRPTVFAVERSMTLAQHTAARLEASGARVVVLARIGQNLGEYGVRYSHLGLAYRENDAGPPVWRIVHKLNQCGSARGSVYRQGLGEFFLDDLYEYEAAFVVLAPAAQAQVLPALRDNARLAQLDTPAYNMLAYPWSVKYQQSNQWALETLAMTQEPAAQTRERAQAWLQLQGYEPTTLRLSALKRLGARVTAANIAFDDHPNEKRFADRIETVTVDSVFRWLARSSLGGGVQVIR